MATYELSDEAVVVVVGSGAGGGTLANELCQRGVKVVLLEAGKRQSEATFVNDEWPSFGQLAWTDRRTTSGTWRVARDFPNLPAWTCKTVGGSTTHWAGASLRFQPHEFKAATTYGRIGGLAISVAIASISFSSVLICFWASWTNPSKGGSGLLSSSPLTQEIVQGMPSPTFAEVSISASCEPDKLTSTIRLVAL